MGSGPKTRASATQRSSDKHPPRTPIGEEGDQARHGGQGCLAIQLSGQGQGQVQIEDFGQGQGPWQRESQGSGEKTSVNEGLLQPGQDLWHGYELPGEGDEETEVVEEIPIEEAARSTYVEEPAQKKAKGLTIQIPRRERNHSRRRTARPSATDTGDPGRGKKPPALRTRNSLKGATKNRKVTWTLKRRTRTSRTEGSVVSDPKVAATNNGNFSQTTTPTRVTVDGSQDSGVGRALAAKVSAVSDGNRVSMGGLSSWLESRLDGLSGQLCKTQPTGRVFPLPTSPLLFSQLFPHASPVARSILRCLVFSLNSMNGEGEGGQMASEYQVKALTGLLEDCVNVESWEAEGAPSWEEFFRVKGVDYKGDEVLTAQMMQWENVRSALPAEVGGVRLEQVVEHGSLHYVKHFEEYLLDEEDQEYVRPPRVLVPPEAWEDFCRNLMDRGVFSRIHEDEVYRVKDHLLLNGLFGVSKHEYDGSWEILRIIMNMVPLNAVTRGLEGDVSTLPAWAGMTPLNLEDDQELVISSEDVRCFFYIFQVPVSWHRFLAFNRPLPPSLAGPKEGNWYPCSAVLPMGFRNSVALAQHVHRYIVQRALAQVPDTGGEAELRKDKPFPRANPMHRIYLDNFDQLCKVSQDDARAIQGCVTPLVQALRDEYQSLGVPRHPKKAVSCQGRAEVQGAIVDGSLGRAFPKVEKVLRYAHLSRLLLDAGEATQKQMQIVGGGLVYMSMFRRPLLGSLNEIWRFIVDCEGYPPFVKFALPEPVKLELGRFLGLIPLAYMDFRNSISPHVTASDASQQGGGVTVSVGLTPAGAVAKQCSLRGDLVEPADLPAVLTVGLFDGIGALRVAADALGWNVAGHISVEKFPAAQRVVESRFPNFVCVGSVEKVDLAMVREWAQKFSQVSLVVLGAGPPCQGVSGLNAARKGALKDARSCLFSHVSRIRDLLRRAFPWAQVQSLMESVASMDLKDQDVMSQSFGEEPWYIDAGGISLAHRPRLYWLEWEINETPGAKFEETSVGRRAVRLDVALDPQDFLEPGWYLAGEGKLPTFTTSRPRV
eukprot:s200_g35.t1